MADGSDFQESTTVNEHRRVGKYELLTAIGEGGMAEVFLARQRGPLDFEKVVVVKTIHPHLAKREQFVRMFLDEARIAAQISHPNVVQVFDLGVEGSTFFIAMEYLAGESLTALLEHGLGGGVPLPPKLAAYVVSQAAEGLHAAHELKSMAGKQLDVVHRDVSPGNLVVLYDGVVKVVDFGVAKAKNRLTETVGQQVKGKFAYMAPEQIQGQPVDRRADVFGLGVVLWETLTLKRLFRADNDAATLQAILGKRPRPPSTVRKGVSKQLDAIALRALAVNPDDRFQSALDMCKALNAVLSSDCKEELAAWMQSEFGGRRRDRENLLERLAHGDRELDVRGLIDKLRSEESASVALPDANFTPSGVTVPPGLMESPSNRRGLWLALGLVMAAVMGLGALLWLTRDPPALSPEPSAVAAGARLEEAEPSDVAPDDPGEVEPSEVEPSEVEPSEVEPPEVEPSEAEPEAVVANGKKPKRKKRGGKRSTGDTATAKKLVDNGVRLFVGGNLGEAENRFKAAMVADPGYAPAFRGLGLVYERAGKNGQAVKMLRKYLRMAPKASDAGSIRKRIAALGG